MIEGILSVRSQLEGHQIISKVNRSGSNLKPTEVSGAKGDMRRASCPASMHSY